MATRATDRFIENLRRIVLFGHDSRLPDDDLLGRFVRERDEAAFEALMRRHGPMVMGVCFRVLRHQQDAEDAFQATFLVLARKAASVRPRKMVGNWLFGVAQLTAKRMRLSNSRRRQRERASPEIIAAAPATPKRVCDWQGVFDQELSRLPAVYRAAIVVCDLEGKTRKEAAEQLGWPEGSVGVRLARARVLLAKRLTRRGVILSGAASISQWTPNIASASPPAALLAVTGKVVVASVAGSLEAGFVSSSVPGIADGVVKMMLLAKLKTTALAIIMLGLLAVGGGCVVHLTTSLLREEAPIAAAVPKPVGDAVPTAKTVMQDPAKSNAPGDAKDGVLNAQKARWGDVSGQIVWGGKEIPALPALAIQPGVVCPKPVVDETWIVNPKSKGLKNTFVWLEPVNKGAKLPLHPDLAAAKPKNIDVDQPACAFIPHALAMRSGDILIAKNSSAIAHNFKYTGDPTVNPGGNFLIPPGQQNAVPGLLPSRMPVAIECNIHPWMKSWLRIFDHPYFAVTDDDGRFTIKNAPVGDCQIKIWHGSSGWLGGAKGRNGEPITIKAGANDLGDKAFPPPVE